MCCAYLKLEHYNLTNLYKCLIITSRASPPACVLTHNLITKVSLK